MDAWLIKTGEPSIKIGISGGFGVTLAIKNTGKEDLLDVKWSVDINGAIFFGRKEGIIPSLNRGRNKN